jgi:hypothetical protein
MGLKRVGRVGPSQGSAVFSPDGVAPALTVGDRASLIRIGEVGPYQGDQIYSTEGIAPTLPAGGGNAGKGSILVSGPMSGTSTPEQSTGSIGETATDGTYELFPQENSPISTACAAAFLASRFRLLASGAGSRMSEEICSSKYSAFWRNRKLIISSLKTLTGCLLTTEDGRSVPSSYRLRDSGIACNGSLLTLDISAWLRTGCECTLSEILEPDPDPKYFLSPEMTAKLTTEKKRKRRW